MMEELCIHVDGNDHVIGSVSKYAAHIGEGVLHRAFSVLMFNNENKLLIQRRSEDKITFPGFWANSCCSHPLFDKNETESGSAIGVAKAAIRKMPQELGLEINDISENDFNLIGRFEYQASDDTEWIEHEIDYVIGIHHEPNLNINPNEVMDYKWLSKKELTEFINDKTNKMAPWFLAIIKLYLNDWWPLSSEDYPEFNTSIINAGVLT